MPLADWLATTSAALCAVALLFAPGLGPAYATGLRGLTAWGAAPLLGGALTGAAAVVCGWLGVQWSVAWVALASAVASLLAWVLWRACGRRRSPTTPPRQRILLALSIALPGVIAVALQLRRTMGAIGGPERIAQTYDTPYHLNSVALILDSGDASSLHMTLSTPDASTTFYPGLWHDLVSLVVQLTGTPIPVAANWVSIGTTCLVWPAGLLALGRVLFGAHPVLLGLVVPASFAMTQFPNRLMSFGILYPNILAYSYLPAALALVVFALLRTHGRGRLPALAALGAGQIGLLLAQPNGLFSLAFVAAPVLAQGLWRASRRLRRRGHGWVVAGAPWVVTAVGIAVAWQGASRVPLVKTFTGRVTWAVGARPVHALEEGLLLTAMHPSSTPNFPEAPNLAPGTPNLLIAALIAVGAVAALTVARWRWVPVAYALVGALWVLVRGMNIPLRGWLTGYWYGDPQRISALLPLVGVPLVVIALGAFAGAAVRLVTRSRPWWSVWRLPDAGPPVPALPARHLTRVSRFAGFGPTQPRARMVAATLASVLVAGSFLSIMVPRTASFRESFAYMSYVYRLDVSSQDSTALTDAHEERLMRRVADIVPEGTTVAGNPWDGSVLVWAYSDRQDLYPHMAVVMDPDRALIAASLRDAKTNPEVCPAVRDLHLGYVLDFGKRFWDAGGAQFPGLVGLEQAGVATLVAQDGNAKLYKITACG